MSVERKPHVFGHLVIIKVSNFFFLLTLMLNGCCILAKYSHNKHITSCGGAISL
jgi:hypothetical protein